MLKYLAIFSVVLGLAVYIATQDEHATKQPAQESAYQNNAAVPAKANEDHPQNNERNSEGNLPGWYGFFRWPNGTTTWAIILTLFAIAEQTRHTARAAEATKESVGAIQAQSGHLETQAGQMSRQADLMREQIDRMVEKERGRIALAPLPVNNFRTNVEWQSIELGINNFGYSPALNVRVISHCEIVRREEYLEGEREDVSWVSSICAGESTKVTIPLFWYPEEHREERGSRRIHLWGRVDYWNIWGGHEETIRFSYAYYIAEVEAGETREDFIEFPIVCAIGWEVCPDPDRET